MAVKASKLIADFQQMADEHWKYVANAEEYGKVDCSGAFTYWYRKEGSKMYHGSNTMWRKWSTIKGKIGEVDLVPGMAVYKNKKDGKEPAEYKNDGQGNFYHVGLYIGDDKVIEAKGTNYGVVTSKLSEWGYASMQKDTVYDVGTEEETEPDESLQGTVTTQTGSLNLRSGPSTSYNNLTTIPKGATVDILKTDTGTTGWYYVRYKNTTGYVMSKYVTIAGEDTGKKYILRLSVDNKSQAAALEAMGITVTYIEAE